jgi:hypothetical protein
VVRNGGWRARTRNLGSATAVLPTRFSEDFEVVRTPASATVVGRPVGAQLKRRAQEGGRVLGNCGHGRSTRFGEERKWRLEWRGLLGKTCATQGSRWRRPAARAAEAGGGARGPVQSATVTE